MMVSRSLMRPHFAPIEVNGHVPVPVRCAEGPARPSRRRFTNGDYGLLPSTLVESKTQESPQTDTLTELKLEGLWKVVVLNDPVNLMSYVVMVFRKVLGFDETKARKHMLEVHEQGRSVVWSGLREQAEAYSHTLQQWHLTTVLEPDETH